MWIEARDAAKPPAIHSILPHDKELSNREVLALKVRSADIEKSFFKRFYLFIFRERGREGESEGDKHQCVVASLVPLTQDLARNPGMCPDWELNRQSFGS